MFVTKLLMSDGRVLQLSRADDYELACADLRDGAFIVVEGDETNPITVMFNNFVFRLGHLVKIKDEFKNESEKGKTTAYKIVSLNEVTRRAFIRPVVCEYEIAPTETVGLEMIVPVAAAYE